MLNLETSIKENKNYNNLTISEVEPIIKINLRSRKREFSAKIGRILSIIPPVESNMSSINDNYSLLWLSPDEWLLYSNNKIYKYEEQINLEDKLFNQISKLNQGAVTNVTDHWVMINLNGNKIYDLLSKGCPFNFNDFMSKKGSVAQTIVNHTDVILHNIDKGNLNIFVRRSFSKHLWSWINDSARFV